MGKPFDFPSFDKHDDFFRLAVLVLKRAGGELRFSNDEICDAQFAHDQLEVVACEDEYSRETVLRLAPARKREDEHDA
jgi:glutamine synthetase